MGYLCLYVTNVIIFKWSVSLSLCHKSQYFQVECISVCMSQKSLFSSGVYLCLYVTKVIIFKWSVSLSVCHKSHYFQVECISVCMSQKSLFSSGVGVPCVSGCVCVCACVCALCV